MFNSERIVDWSQLTLQHLLVAYRKAKVDCYFERSQCDAEDFVAFEGNLGPNLEFILLELRAGRLDRLLRASIGANNGLEETDFSSLEHPPEYTHEELAEIVEALRGQIDHPAQDAVLNAKHATREVVAKKLERIRKPDAGNGHGYFSRPERALQHLQSEFELAPEFRLIGRFSVLGHVLSALWINLVGHRFDAVLSDDVYGARVRRYRPKPGEPRRAKGDYQVDAPGTFPPYFGPYRHWRSNGFVAIERELKADKRVVALSLDLSNYYHRIDPRFIALPGFQEAIKVDLNDFERGFTQALADSLGEWSASAAAHLRELGCSVDGLMGGIPIGLSCTRLIANVLLFQLDAEVRRELAPVYYGRYVDDVFLVLADGWEPEIAPTTESVFEFISKRVPCLKTGGAAGVVTVEFGDSYAGASKLCFQERKQKVFFLDGQAGLDLLGSIRQHISSVASERRFMPDPDELEETAAAQVLTAGGNVAEEADSLRRADGLSVRRLGWAIQLRNVETLARDLRPPDWYSQRKTFYQFACNHVLRADRMLDHVDYLPRLVAMAVSLRDWDDALRILRSADEALDALAHLDAKEYRCNGYHLPCTRDLFDELKRRNRRVCADAVLRALPWREQSMVDLSGSAPELLFVLGLRAEGNSVLGRALRLREADLARTPYVEHVRWDARAPRTKEAFETNLIAVFPQRELSAMQEFLVASPGVGQESCARTNADIRRSAVAESLLPYFFPTRPYTARAIALHDPRCVHGPDATERWARYVRAFRGVWVTSRAAPQGEPIEMIQEAAKAVAAPAEKLASDEGPHDESEAVAEAPVWTVGRRRWSQVRLGISSLWTDDATWSLSADGKQDLGLDRYKRIQKMVNRAVEASPGLTHLLLPEFALPARWLESVTRRLALADISLVTGLDYFSAEKGTVYSEAALILSDDRLGYPSTIEIRQPKGVPARDEEEKLLRLFEKSWSDVAKVPKPVVSHRGFDFGVLVCSELQNIRHRSSFQGQVDCVMVLSWNRDVETFSALVESAALDVHAYIALVNNRQYGDSRVRSPAKKAYERDLCRLQGGKDDYLAVVELDIKALREFQSRERAWSRKDDPFKPVPEGFKIAGRRRRVPK